MPQYDSPQAKWFDEEIRVHEPALRAYARSHFPDEHDVDDLIQESYLRVIRVAQSISIAHPKAYLFTTLRNAAFAIFRRPRIISEIPITDFQALRIPDDSAGVAETVSRKEEIEILLNVIDSLPRRCREIFIFRKLHGLSQKEIAARLGLSVQTVQVQVARGARKCEKLLRAQLI